MGPLWGQRLWAPSSQLSGVGSRLVGLRSRLWGLSNPPLRRWGIDIIDVLLSVVVKAACHRCVGYSGRLRSPVCHRGTQINRSGPDALLVHMRLQQVLRAEGRMCGIIPAIDIVVGGGMDSDELIQFL